MKFKVEQPEQRKVTCKEKTLIFQFDIDSMGDAVLVCKEEGSKESFQLVLWIRNCDGKLQLYDGLSSDLDLPMDVRRIALHD